MELLPVINSRQIYWAERKEQAPGLNIGVMGKLVVLGPEAVPPEAGNTSEAAVQSGDKQMMKRDDSRLIGY